MFPKKRRNRASAVLIILRNLLVSVLYLIAYLCFCLLYDPGSVLESSQIVKTVTDAGSPIVLLMVMETISEIVIRCR